MKRRLQFRLKDIRRAWQDWITLSRWTKWLIGVSVLFLVATFLLPLIRLVPFVEPGQYLPLHYNIFFGVDRFGPWYHIFTLPGIGALILVCNVLFSLRFARKEVVLSSFLMGTTLACEVILFVAMVFIMLLNV